MQAAGQLAQLAAGQRRLLAGGGEPLLRALRVVLELAEREVDRLAEDDEPLLRAVVQVAPDPAALLVGGVHGAGAAGDDLVRAGAQCALVAAAVQLGGGAGGEDLQRVQLARRRVQGAERDHADVADRAAVGAAQGDREVAVEPWALRNASAG